MLVLILPLLLLLMLAWFLFSLSLHCFGWFDLLSSLFLLIEDVWLLFSKLDQISANHSQSLDGLIYIYLFGQITIILFTFLQHSDNCSGGFQIYIQKFPLLSKINNFVIDFVSYIFVFNLRDIIFKLFYDFLRISSKKCLYDISVVFEYK
jgi:hypothetical protein